MWLWNREQSDKDWFTDRMFPKSKISCNVSLDFIEVISAIELLDNFELMLEIIWTYL